LFVREAPYFFVSKNGKKLRNLCRLLHDELAKSVLCFVFCVLCFLWIADCKLFVFCVFFDKRGCIYDFSNLGLFVRDLGLFRVI
jgi:hypothetical protein